jgi:hypothetical protein
VLLISLAPYRRQADGREFGKFPLHGTSARPSQRDNFVGIEASPWVAE